MMKNGTIYRSKHSRRLWAKMDGVIKTRHSIHDVIWRNSGDYGVPLMWESDIDFYIQCGDFEEVIIE